MTQKRIRKDDDNIEKKTVESPCVIKKIGMEDYRNKGLGISWDLGHWSLGRVVKSLNVLLYLSIFTSSSIHITNLFEPSSTIAVFILSLSAPSASLISIFIYSELNPRRKRISKGVRLHMNIKTFFMENVYCYRFHKNTSTSLH